jgi:hypothetical protein
MSLGDFEMNYAEYIDGTQTADDLAAMERCRPYIHEFEAQRENGPAGVLRQAEIVRAALTDLSEDFFVFTHAVGLSTFHSLHVVQLGERIRKLRQLLGGKLDSVALLHLILQDQHSFELAVDASASINESHAVQLLDDILDSIEAEPTGRGGWSFKSNQIGFGYFKTKYPKYT